MFRRRPFWIVSLLAVALFLAGCDGKETEPNNGGTDSGGSDAASDTSEPGTDGATNNGTDTVDNESPEFRDLSASIKGEFSAELDLSSEDQTHVLPAAADATFTVFATDEETDAENLQVAVVDSSDTELESEATFSNGLWRLDVTVAPDTTLHVDVTDEDGATTSSEYSLIIPSRRDALVDGWTRLLYNEEGNIDARWPVEFNDDGTWEIAQDEDGAVFGGNWSVDGKELIVEETYREGDDPDKNDSDRNTAEWRRVTSFYVDETYVSTNPWERTADDGGLILGTWERSYEVYEPSEGSLELARELTETLQINDDDTWTVTRIGTDHVNAAEIDRSVSGTYVLEVNEDYSENYGNYFTRTTTHEDGEALDTPRTETDLQVKRMGLLLLTPSIRDVE